MPAKSSKSVNNDKKVMDISKPGKGKVVATSRPVVAPITSNTEAETAPEISSPSAARKVIQPITPADELIGEESKEPKKAPAKATSIKIITNTPEDNEEPVEVKPVEEDKPVPETSEEPAPEEPKEEPKEEPEKEETPAEPEAPAAETPEPDAQEEVPQEEPEQPAETPPELKPEPVSEEKPPVEPPAPADAPKPAEPKDAPPAEAAPPVPDAGSDSANVDAIAQSAETKKEAARKAEEKAKKDAELQNLIDSKQYFVPIGHHAAATKKGRGLIVFLAVLIAVIVVAYLAVDSELVDVGLKLPYDLI